MLYCGSPGVVPRCRDPEVVCCSCRDPDVVYCNCRDPEVVCVCIMVGAQNWPATYLIYIVETQVCGLPRVFVFLSTTEATTAVE